MKAARQFVLGTLWLAAAVRLCALFAERAFVHPVKNFHLESAAAVFVPLSTCPY